MMLGDLRDSETQGRVTNRSKEPARGWVSVLRELIEAERPVMAMVLLGSGVCWLGHAHLFYLAFGAGGGRRAGGIGCCGGFAGFRR